MRIKEIEARLAAIKQDIEARGESMTAEENPHTMKLVRQAIHSVNVDAEKTDSAEGSEEEVVDEIK